MKEKLPPACASVSAIKGSHVMAHWALQFDLPLPSRSNTYSVMPLRSTRALPLAVSALIGGVVWATTESAERQTMPLAQATQTAATIGIRIHFSSCMIAKKPAPDSIFGGCRFSEKIMLKQQTKAKC